MDLLTEKVGCYDKRRLARRIFWQDTWWFAITICKTSLGNRDQNENENEHENENQMTQPFDNQRGDV